jgi:hypothetical protein
MPTPEKSVPKKTAPDTLALLRTGGVICVIGLAFAAITSKCGVGIHGPTNNLGWLTLILFIMCMPFGLMLFALGIAKWLRGRRG